jgi:hypothetical protein
MRTSITPFFFGLGFATIKMKTDEGYEASEETEEIEEPQLSAQL